MGASFEEKSVWVQLVGLAAGLGAYFVVAGIMLANGVRVLAPFVPVFAVALVFLITLMVVGHVLAAITRKPEAADERDRVIEWRAESHTAWMLPIGVFLAITGLLFAFEPVWIAHLLLLSLFIAEMAKLALQALYYRRGV
ncbi:MAG: hypothetical protein ACF8QF_04535 [Phycisphaerales bacterium]